MKMTCLANDGGVERLRFADVAQAANAMQCVANRETIATAAASGAASRSFTTTTTASQNINLAATGAAVMWSAPTNAADVKLWQKKDAKTITLHTESQAHNKPHLAGNSFNIAACNDMVTIFDATTMDPVFRRMDVLGKFIAPSSNAAVHFVAATKASKKHPGMVVGDAKFIKFVDMREQNGITRNIETNSIYAACADPDGGMIGVNENGVFRYDVTSSNLYTPLEKTIRVPEDPSFYSRVKRVVVSNDVVLLVHPQRPVLLPMMFSDWRREIPESMIENTYFPQLPQSWTSPVCDGAICVASNDADERVVVLVCEDGKWGAWQPSAGGSAFMTSDDDKSTPLIGGVVTDPENAKFVYVILKGSQLLQQDAIPQKVSFRVQKSG